MLDAFGGRSPRLAAAGLVVLALVGGCRAARPRVPAELPEHLRPPSDPSIPPFEPPPLWGLSFHPLTREDLPDGRIRLTTLGRTFDGAAHYRAADVVAAGVVGHRDWGADVVQVPRPPFGTYGNVVFRVPTEPAPYVFEVEPVPGPRRKPLVLWVLTWIDLGTGSNAAHSGGGRMRGWEEQYLEIPEGKR